MTNARPTTNIHTQMERMRNAVQHYANDRDENGSLAFSDTRLAAIVRTLNGISKNEMKLTSPDEKGKDVSVAAIIQSTLGSKLITNSVKDYIKNIPVAPGSAMEDWCRKNNANFNLESPKSKSQPEVKAPAVTQAAAPEKLSWFQKAKNFLAENLAGDISERVEREQREARAAASPKNTTPEVKSPKSQSADSAALGQPISFAQKTTPPPKWERPAPGSPTKSAPAVQQPSSPQPASPHASTPSPKSRSALANAGSAIVSRGKIIGMEDGKVQAVDMSKRVAPASPKNTTPETPSQETSHSFQRRR